MQGFDLSFWGVLSWKMGEAILGPGMRHSFCRVLVGARKEIVLILRMNKWMDHTGEEPRRARVSQESSSNR